MVLLGGILSLGVLTSVSAESTPCYGFRYRGRQVHVCYMGCLGGKGLYRCAPLRFDSSFIVEGSITGEFPKEDDYLSAASNAFEELEMREPTEPFRFQTLEVVSVRNAADFMNMRAHFLGDRTQDDYYP